MAFPLVCDPTHGVASRAEDVVLDTIYAPPALYVYVGTAGDLEIDPASGDGTPCVLHNVPSGTLLPVSVRQILSANTTASDIVVLA